MFFCLEQHPVAGCGSCACNLEGVPHATAQLTLKLLQNLKACHMKPAEHFEQLDLTRAFSISSYGFQMFLGSSCIFDILLWFSNVPG